MFRRASWFTSSTVGLGNRLVCTRIKTMKYSQPVPTCSCNNICNEAAVRGGIIWAAEIHILALWEQNWRPAWRSDFFILATTQRRRWTLLGCDTPYKRWLCSRWVHSVRSADPELYRVSPCRAGHHQWLGSGSGAWLPLKEAVMTLLNNEGGHTTHPYPLWQPDSHGSA